MPVFDSDEPTAIRRANLGIIDALSRCSHYMREGDVDRMYTGSVEVIMWVSGLDELYKRSSPGYSDRRDWDPGGQIVNALRWARDKGIHDWSHSMAHLTVRRTTLGSVQVSRMVLPLPGFGRRMLYSGTRGSGKETRRRRRLTINGWATDQFGQHWPLLGTFFTARARGLLTHRNRVVPGTRAADP